MKKVIAFAACWLFFAGGFTMSDSSTPNSDLAIKEKSGSASECPYLRNKDKCPYSENAYKSYIVKQPDFIKDIKKT